MKKILLLMAIIPYLTACDSLSSTEKEAASMIKMGCLKDGGSPAFCDCVRADLLTLGGQNWKDAAYYLMDGREHSHLQIIITGARLRCECRTRPAWVERTTRQPGICSQVPRLKY